jgi:RNA polymerase sigma-B factor
VAVPQDASRIVISYDASTPEEDLFSDRDDPAARAEIVARYTQLAERLAMRYRGRGEPLDDLKQVAAVGLLNAIARYDHGREAKFATFATVTILGELRRHLRDKTWSVRVPRSLQERWLEASRTSTALAQRLGRSPTIAEIATDMGVTPEDVIEAIDAGSAYTSGSLDAPLGSERGSATVGDMIAHIDDHLEAAHARVAVSVHMRDLPERERLILYLRFFDGLTQSEIAEMVGISQMHVSRLLRRSLGRLRELLADQDAGGLLE